MVYDEIPDLGELVDGEAGARPDVTDHDAGHEVHICLTILCVQVLVRIPVRVQVHEAPAVASPDALIPLLFAGCDLLTPAAALALVMRVLVAVPAYAEYLLAVPMLMLGLVAAIFCGSLSLFVRLPERLPYARRLPPGGWRGWFP